MAPHVYFTLIALSGWLKADCRALNTH